MDYCIDIIFIDFAKSVDTIIHKKRIITSTKLKCYGIAGKILEWITDYLKDRTQHVTVEGKSLFPGL